MGHDVCLVAVSKYQTIDGIKKLYQAGQRDFGENYVQALADRASELVKLGMKDIRWHFIGHLQRNKVKTLLPHVHMIHAVDSERLGIELNKRWVELGNKNRLPFFVQVNIDSEDSKSGIERDNTQALCESLAELKSLELLGLMCIPQQGSSQKAFEALQELGEQCRNWTQGKLSMGMSADYELALQAGATHLRVGTALWS